MNTDIEQVLVKALRMSDGNNLLSLACFQGFASEEEILAAFIDDNLNAEQQLAFKGALASRNSLREQWQYLKEATAAVGQQRAKKRELWIGAAMVASVALVAVLFYPGDQLPDSHLGDPVVADRQQTPVLEAQVESAPAMAAQAQMPDWQAWLDAYTGTVPASAVDDDTAAARFVQLAIAARAVNQSGCSDTAVARLKERFALSRQDYGQELFDVIPLDRADWCQLGEKLKQKATLAVLKGQNQ